MDRVVKGGPWTFDKHLLLMKKLDTEEDPTEVELNKTDFWVHIFDEPVGLQSEKVLRDVGNFIRIFVESDSKNRDGNSWSYLRIRVSLDVQKPIKRKMKIKKVGGEWSWLNFKYERLPMFCFYCGVIGHADSFCEKLFDNPGKVLETPYGSWLRATTRALGSNTGKRWLCHTTDSSSGGV